MSKKKMTKAQAEEAARDERATRYWPKPVVDLNRNEIQFARLIDEMMAALSGRTVTKMINDMAVSMDLSIGEVNKLLDYAVSVWEDAKPAR